ncbi:MAG TPA: cob(I)yrinic acid a,c-diamide adenosyltransferase [Fredinandcohnia sp.]|nr:cob(I)yrinic acid a,c-diamide adenosyltransferase [Fredinandcohnia sp.]
MAFRIYTRTGDKGDTGLFGGGRVRKDDPRVEAYGTVDELNAAIGLAAATTDDAQVRDWLRRIQSELFVLGAELATPDPAHVKKQVAHLDAETIARWEQVIDTIDAEVPPLQHFVLPGGAPAAAHLHLARTICRRAERRLLSLAAQAEIRSECVAYLNRLSDLLFMLARLLNHRGGVDEPIWEAPLKSG